MNKRRLAALGMVIALLLCGCDGKIHTAAPMIWEQASREQAAIKPLQFPITLPDSGLVAEELRCYTGPYLEDGSGEITEEVAGLMVYNPTDRLIEFAAFSVEQGTQRLYFFAYHLPPKSRCLVLEYNKNSCNPAAATACNELSIRWDQQEFSREQIDYVGLGSQMTLINRDSRQLRHITVWYKRYIKSEDYYLGGAVYAAHVFDLQTGERRTIWPEHYEAGCAKIVGIELEI